MRNRLRKIRVALLKWHRRIGVLAAVFAICLATTGVLINHAHDLGWDRTPLHSRLLLKLYGVSNPTVNSGFIVQQHWITEISGRLYFDTSKLAECKTPLLGVVFMRSIGAALCSDGMIFFNEQGKLIEKSSLFDSTVNQLGNTANDLFTRTSSQLYRIDLETGEWQATAETSGIEWSEPKPLPDAMQSELTLFSTPAELTRERFLLDLHSGRLFGNAGVYFVDAVGVVIFLLALSGAWAWLARRFHS